MNKLGRFLSITGLLTAFTGYTADRTFSDASGNQEWFDANNWGGTLPIEGTESTGDSINISEGKTIIFDPVAYAAANGSVPYSTVMLKGAWSAFQFGSNSTEFNTKLEIRSGELISRGPDNRIGQQRDAHVIISGGIWRCLSDGIWLGNSTNGRAIVDISSGKMIVETGDFILGRDAGSNGYGRINLSGSGALELASGLGLQSGTHFRTAESYINFVNTGSETTYLKWEGKTEAEITALVNAGSIRINDEVIDYGTSSLSWDPALTTLSIRRGQLTLRHQSPTITTVEQLRDELGRATIQWNQLGSNYEYIVEYSNLADFSNSTSVPMANANSLTLDGLNGHSTYYAKVRAVDPNDPNNEQVSNTISVPTLYFSLAGGQRYGANSLQSYTGNRFWMYGLTIKDKNNQLVLDHQQDTANAKVATFNDFTDLACQPMYANQSYEFTFIGHDSWGGSQVWVDWNRDGDFEDAEEDWFSLRHQTAQNGRYVVTVTKQIPSFAKPGPILMRVRDYDFGQYPAREAECITYSASNLGEVEDYVLNIEAPPVIIPDVTAYIMSNQLQWTASDETDVLSYRVETDLSGSWAEVASITQGGTYQLTIVPSQNYRVVAVCSGGFETPFYPSVYSVLTDLSSAVQNPAADLTLMHTFPSTNWERHSFPIGNGRLGCMQSGDVAQEEIQFNVDSLWTGTENPSGADGSMGDYQNFGHIFLELTGAAGDRANAANYERKLNIAEALHSVNYEVNGTTFQRESFASNPKNAIIKKFTASTPGQYSGTLHLVDAHDLGTDLSGNRKTIPGSFSGNVVLNGVDAIYDPASVDASVAGQLTISGDFSDPNNNSMNNPGSTYNNLQYKATVKLIHEGGSVTTENGVITFANCDSITLVLVADTNYVLDHSQGFFQTFPDAKLNQDLTTAATANYEAMKAEHVADFKHYFDRMSLDLGQTEEVVKGLNTKERIDRYRSGPNFDPDLEETLFQFGRYLLISSSREGTLPANLQGIWNIYNTPPWHSDYHTNINVQMCYWLAEPTNLSELAMPFMDLAFAQIEPWTNATKNEWGVGQDGFTMRTSTNIFGGGGWNWNIPASAWYAQHFYDHYLFTKDETYLRNVAYPFMRGVVEYWEDHLKRLPDGTLVAPNGWSPEHGPTEDGVAHDQQIIWDVLTNYVEMERVLGTDPTYLTTVEGMLADLQPGLRIGSWGQLQEWMVDRDDPNNNHRHTSHLYCVYPGRQVSEQLTPEFERAAEISLEARGSVGDSRRSWTWAWRSALWARMNRADKTHEMIQGLLQYNMLDNLISTHTPLQLDGSMGISGGIAEMLLQSQTGSLVLLPALPPEWSRGQVKGLKGRGNYTVNMEWENGDLTKAIVVSASTQTCRIMTPESVVVTELNSGTPISATIVDGVLTFPITADTPVLLTVLPMEKPALLNKHTQIKVDEVRSVNGIALDITNTLPQDYPYPVQYQVRWKAAADADFGAPIITTDSSYFIDQLTPEVAYTVEVTVQAVRRDSSLIESQPVEVSFVPYTQIGNHVEQARYGVRPFTGNNSVPPRFTISKVQIAGVFSNDTATAVIDGTKYMDANGNVWFENFPNVNHSEPELAVLNPFDYHTLEIEVFDPQSYARIQVWVDWNNDGDFADAGETLLNVDANGDPALLSHNINLNIPQEVADYVRIRIMTSNSAMITPNSVVDRCPADMGYAQDYTLRMDRTLSPVLGLEVTNSDGLLSWQVGQEDRVSHYTVQQWINGAWVDVATFNRGEVYQLAVEADQAYRLLVVDIDGFKQVFNVNNQADQLVTWSIKPGWSLLALPLVAADLSELHQIKSGALWRWNGHFYEKTSEPQPLEGFWVYSHDVTELEIKGKRLTEPTVTLQPGWNLFGPSQNMVAPFNEAQAIYGWSDTYESILNDSQILIQGQGYWFYSEEEKTIDLK